MRGIAWPRLDAIAGELDRSQWLPRGELEQAQQRQLAEVVRHAPTAPYYEDALRGWDGTWANLPVLTRDAAIAAGPRLASRRYPADHGETAVIFTSRSTGAPVQVRSTAVTLRLWYALTLRDHAWHGRDLRGKLAAIRHTSEPAPPPHGARRRGWGPATDALVPDAPLVVLSVRSTTDEQIAWLRREAPDYLIGYPNVVDAIAARLAPERLPGLREVRTISETLTAEVRARVRERLGAPVVDTYSAEEVGYLGMQCPTADPPAFHVPETVVVEVLRDDGTACEVGEVGRVVVTSLHNFATPILRYELGDYAEVGAPCACGRGLPVLARVVGRQRGILHYPDGRTTWPVFTIACREVAQYRELQLVQETVTGLRLRVVADQPVDEAALAAAVRRALGHEFEVAVERVAELSRSPAGKLEEFVSLVRRT